MNKLPVFFVITACFLCAHTALTHEATAQELCKRYNTASRILNASRAGISAISDHEFFMLYQACPELEELYLNDNKIKTLSPNIALFKNLQILDLRDTGITELPLQALSHLKKLKKLLVNQASLLSKKPSQNKLFMLAFTNPGLQLCFGTPTL